MIISIIKYSSFIFLFLYISISLSAQNVQLQKDRIKINFDIHTDLIILEVNLNGYSRQNFILDTGSNGVIVFDEKFFSPEQLKSAKIIKLRGLGADSLLTGKRIEGNKLRLHPKFYADSISVYSINHGTFNLGAKFGLEIHGIIGNDIFRNLILDINYTKEKITVYKEDFKNKNYKETDLIIENKKPFITLSDHNNKEFELLIDTGGTDALWLFESDVNWNEVSHIRDFLGFGLSGEVIGNRIKKDSIYLENILIEKIYLAVPDTIYTNYIRKMYPRRNGSVGGAFLKKFNWIIDYPNKKIYYKPNYYFKYDFTYNVTGLEIFQPISFLNMFVIESILLESVAYKSGLRAGDMVMKINNIPVQNLSLEKIYKILNNSKAKKMTITVNRNGQIIYKQLPIRDILNGE